jgi:hypothetical protein
MFKLTFINPDKYTKNAIKIGGFSNQIGHQKCPHLSKGYFWTESADKKR